MDNLVERTDFVSVPVQDMERAKAFYRDVLGMHSPDIAHVALRVADVAAARRQLEGRGVSFAGEHDPGVCRMAFFRDSEGNSLMLHRRYAP